MFGKPQIIKFEQNLCKASVNDNSILFVRVNDVLLMSSYDVRFGFHVISSLPILPIQTVFFFLFSF